MKTTRLTATNKKKRLDDEGLITDTRADTRRKWEKGFKESPSLLAMPGPAPVMFTGGTIPAMAMKSMNFPGVEETVVPARVVPAALESIKSVAKRATESVEDILIPGLRDNPISAVGRGVVSRVMKAVGNEFNTKYHIEDQSRRFFAKLRGNSPNAPSRTPRYAR